MRLQLLLVELLAHYFNTACNLILEQQSLTGLACNGHPCMPCDTSAVQS